MQSAPRRRSTADSCSACAAAMPPSWRCCRRARPASTASPRSCSALRDGGRDLPSALRVARQLVLERLAVLDVEQGARARRRHRRHDRPGRGHAGTGAGAGRRPRPTSATARRWTRRGSACEFWIVGMGKLGARELNVSSDIDLIYVYEDDGQTAGRDGRCRSTSTSRFVAKRLYALIGDTTDDGFVFRVDLALRPNGNSGPPVVSLGMLEEYLQVQGREWERFAWLKSRVVAPRAAVSERPRAGAALAGHALRLPALPGLRRLRRPAPAAPQDPRRGAAPRRRPPRARQRRQALARRHPRDRVHRAADAGRARRPVPRDPHAQHAARRCSGWSRAA